jgi:two-component system chemotaxis response regulator CheY
MARILIVDDALFMRKMIRDALVPLGFEIAGEAEDGRQGLELFRELHPDVTTMDIIMPEMDGLECLRSIREGAPGARVVMITAVDQREPMLEAMKLGVADFIVKPFDETRVVSAVQKALATAEVA